MSNTERHRPVWVQSVERGTEEDHRHGLFGTPVTHRRKKRDKRGHVITAVQPVSIMLKNAVALPVYSYDAPARQARIRAIREEAQRRLDAGAYWWEIIDGPEVADQPVWEDHLLGHYANRCTIDDMRDRDGRVSGHHDIYAPCTRDLNWVEKWPAYGRDPGERKYGINRDPRRPTRRRLRNAIRALAKDADTYIDSDELDSDMYTR